MQTAWCQIKMEGESDLSSDTDNAEHEVELPTALLVVSTSNLDNEINEDDNFVDPPPLEHPATPIGSDQPSEAVDTTKMANKWAWVKDADNDDVAATMGSSAQPTSGCW